MDDRPHHCAIGLRVPSRRLCSMRFCIAQSSHRLATRRRIALVDVRQVPSIRCTPRSPNAFQLRKSHTSCGNKTVTVSASASANVVGVQFRLDGNNLGAEVASPPYSVSWGTTTTANGTHTLTAVGRDAPGNTATSAPVSVNVSNRTGRHKKH